MFVYLLNVAVNKSGKPMLHLGVGLALPYAFLG